jgi:hypothetical protein
VALSKSQVVSEITRLLSAIEAEYVAGRRALNDPAIVAPHEVITARMENMRCGHEKLSQLVGGAMGAMKLIAERLERLEQLEG